MKTIFILITILMALYNWAQGIKLGKQERFQVAAEFRTLDSIILLLMAVLLWKL
jgi:hypothetical protein